MKISKSTQAYTVKTQLLNALNKLKFAFLLINFSDSQTIQQCQIECQRIFSQNIDQVHTIIIYLIDYNQITRLQGQKEHIKLFGILAQILRQDMIDHLHLIIGFVIRKLSDKNTQINQLNPILADTLGIIVQACFENLDCNMSIKHVGVIMKPLYNHLQQFPQHSLCLTRIIQSLPVGILELQATQLLNMVIQLLQLNSKGKVELLEAILAIMLSVEHKAKQINCDNYVSQLSQCVTPLLIPLLQNSDWQVRKMSMDVLYTMAVLAPSYIKQDTNIRQIVCLLKSDKIKKVREAANLVYGILQDLSEVESVTRRSDVQQLFVKAPEEIQKETEQVVVFGQSFLEHRLDVTISLFEQFMEMMREKGLVDTKDIKPFLLQLQAIKHNDQFQIDNSSILFSPSNSRTEQLENQSGIFVTRQPLQEQQFCRNSFTQAEEICKIQLSPTKEQDENFDQHKFEKQQLQKAKKVEETQKPFMEAQQTYMEIQQTYMEIQQPFIDIQQPLIEIQQHILEIQQPYIEIQQPLILINQPSIQIHQPFIDVHQPMMDIHQPLMEIQQERTFISKEAAAILQEFKLKRDKYIATS